MKIKRKYAKRNLIYKIKPEFIHPLSFKVAEEQGAYKVSRTIEKKPTNYHTYFRDPEIAAKLIRGDCLEVMADAPTECVDMIFADPPYFLSNNGISCQAGQMVSVNKGKWDISQGVIKDHEFIKCWLAECKRLLKPNGTIWVSGTLHVIYSVGFAMQELGYKILNDIIWEKINPPPNLSCRYFTHSTEIILWAKKSEKARHYYDYELMRKINHGKQMKNVWHINAPERNEKRYGKHPTQKPEKLIERIVLASTEKGQLVLDPFVGSGTTGVVAIRLGRKFVGIDMEEDFLRKAKSRIIDEKKATGSSLFSEVPSAVDDNL